MPPGRDTTSWTVNEPGLGPLLPVRELWAGRELVGFFALRDLKLRYKQAVLGVVWVLLQPVVTVLAFTFVFDRLADVDSQGVPYPVFALAGLLGWTYVSQCIARGSEVLVANTQLVTKVYFPRMTAPLASLLPPGVDLVVGLALLAIACLVYGVVPGPGLLLFPVWLVLLALVALGPTCFLAAANVRYRDVRQVVPTALQVLLFLSPVGYSTLSIDEPARTWLGLNPVVGVLELGRYVLVGGDWPGWVLAVSVGVALVTAVGGVVYFSRAARSFADVI